MDKGKYILEEVRDGRVYQMFCSPEASFGELHDVLLKMKGYCVDKMREAQEEEEAIAEKMNQIDEANKIEA